MDKELVEQGKAQIELAVEALVQAKSDEAVHLILAEIAKAIPGGLDDAAIAAVEPKVKEVVKAKLLELAEKISPLV